MQRPILLPMFIPVPGIEKALIVWSRKKIIDFAISLIGVLVRHSPLWTLPVELRWSRTRQSWTRTPVAMFSSYRLRYAGCESVWNAIDRRRASPLPPSRPPWPPPAPSLTPHHLSPWGQTMIRRLPSSRKCSLPLYWPERRQNRRIRLVHAFFFCLSLAEKYNL